MAENLFPSHVKSHWRIFNTNSHFCCQICDAIFKDVELYKSHVDAVHPGSPKVLKIVYKCPICSLNYSKTGRVKDHILQVYPFVLHDWPFPHVRLRLKFQIILSLIISQMSTMDSLYMVL